MLMEVYYKHYMENCKDRYWELEKKSIPYMVLFPTVEKMRCLMEALSKDGLRCVGANYDYRGLLVNLELMRFAVIQKACKHSCVDGRTFMPEEFVSEVYGPWRSGQPRASTV